jgi:hypothetical protein
MTTALAYFYHKFPLSVRQNQFVLPYSRWGCNVNTGHTQRTSILITVAILGQIYRGTERIDQVEVVTFYVNHTCALRTPFKGF